MAEALEGMDDKQLYDELEKAGLVNKLWNDPAWKMFREASNRIVERALAEFVLRVDPNDTVKVIQFQTILKKYKYGLFEEVKILKNESEMLFEEAKARGLLGSALHEWKLKLFG